MDPGQYRASADLSRVAIRGRCLGVFRAPNPWKGGALDGWTVNVYSAVALSYVEVFVADQANRGDPPEQLAPQQWPALGDRTWFRKQGAIGIESSDGRHHLLPRALDALCRDGTIALEQLPGVIHPWGHRFANSDFPFDVPHLVFTVLAPVWALGAFVLIGLRWLYGWRFLDNLEWPAIALLMPLALSPAFPLRWRAREARLRQAMVASAQRRWATPPKASERTPQIADQPVIFTLAFLFHRSER